MIATELQEIRDYWNKKYPNIDITLYPRPDDGKYRGRMTSHNSSFDLEADTVGELISQGESFLRQVNR